jgi:hypothetical protein
MMTPVNANFDIRPISHDLPIVLVAVVRAQAFAPRVRLADPVLRDDDDTVTRERRPFTFSDISEKKGVVQDLSQRDHVTLVLRVDEQQPVVPVSTFPLKNCVLVSHPLVEAWRASISHEGGLGRSRSGRAASENKTRR